MIFKDVFLRGRGVEEEFCDWGRGGDFLGDY